MGLSRSAARPLQSGPNDRASIAILPFDNLSGDPEQAYFVDGIAEEILTALAAFKQLQVIARNSSFAFKNRPTDVREIGRRLGVRYVLEGSVRRASGRVRIAAQLIETEKGAHIWAENLESVLADVFDLQDEITARVVAAIEPAIHREEIELARRKRPENLVAYDLFLRALPHLYAMTPSDNDAAMELLERALTEAPHFAAALAYAAWGLEQRLSRAWPNVDAIAPTLARSPMRERPWRPARTTPTSSPSPASCSPRSAAIRKAAFRPCAEPRPSTRTAPSSVTSWAQRTCSPGILKRRRQKLEMAKRLSLTDPSGFLLMTAIGCAHLLSGDPETALAICARSAAMNPKWDFTWWISAAAAGELGDEEKAR